MRILGHEAVTRVAAVGASLLGDPHHLIDVQVRRDRIGLLSRWRFDLEGLVGALERAKKGESGHRRRVPWSPEGAVTVATPQNKAACRAG